MYRAIIYRYTEFQTCKGILKRIMDIIVYVINKYPVTVSEGLLFTPHLMALATWRQKNGLRPLNSTRQHGFFLKSTGDIRHSDMRQGTEIDSDMRHCHFLSLCCAIMQISVIYDWYFQILIILLIFDEFK